MAIKKQDSNIYETSNKYQEYEKLYLKNDIFHNLESINAELSCDVIDSIQNQEMKLNEILSVIEKDNRENWTFQDFKFIGIKRFENMLDDGMLIILEIYLRLVEKNDNKVAFEFIFQ